MKKIVHRLGPYTTPAAQKTEYIVIKGQHGPITIDVHGTAATFDIDIQGVVFSPNTIDSVAPNWVILEEAIIQTSAMPLVLYAEMSALRIDVDAIAATGNVYIDICYTGEA